MIPSIHLEQIDHLLDSLEQAANSTKDTLAFAEMVVQQLATLTGAQSVEVFAALSTVSRQEGKKKTSTRAEAAVDVPSATDAMKWVLMRRAGIAGLEDQLTWLNKTLVCRPVQADSAAVTARRRVSNVCQYCVALSGDDQESVLGAIVVSIPEPCPTSADAGILALLESYAEIVGERFRASHRRMRGEDETRYDQFLTELYACESMDQFIDCLAHDLPVLLHCQRIAVLRRRGRKSWKLTAITGAAETKLQTQIVRDIESFTAKAADKYQPHLCVAPESIALDTGNPVGDRRDGANDQDTLVIPFALPSKYGKSSGIASKAAMLDGKSTGNARPVADMVLLIQWESSLGIGRGLPWVPRIFNHVTLGAGRMEDQAGGLARFAKIGFLRRSTVARRIAFWMLIVGLFGLGFWATFGLQVDFSIEAKGAVEPIEQRFIFATHDGYVSEVAVEDGAKVNEGDVLIRLRSPQLEIQERELAGEIAAASKRMDGLTIAISQLDSGLSDSTIMARQLAAEVESLEARLNGLQKQRELVAEQSAELVLHCPIDGTVITWDAIRDLQSRPVRRGDALLKVANIDGRWKMRLWVPDREFNHIRSVASSAMPTETTKLPTEVDLDEIDATEADTSPGDGNGLNVVFKMMSRPNEEYRGTLLSIGNTVQTPEGMGPAVAVDFSIAKEKIEGLQVGATTAGRIQCGRRPWWYVWTRTLQESLQRRFWIKGE